MQHVISRKGGMVFHYLGGDAQNLHGKQWVHLMLTQGIIRMLMKYLSYKGGRETRKMKVKGG